MISYTITATLKGSAEQPINALINSRRDLCGASQGNLRQVMFDWAAFLYQGKEVQQEFRMRIHPIIAHHATVFTVKKNGETT